MSGFDESTEEYQSEEYQDGDAWLGGTSDGDSAEPSNHEETYQLRTFDVPQGQDTMPAWQDGTAPKIENFSTIEEFQAAEREYALRPPVPWEDDPYAAQRQDLAEYMQQCERGRALAEAAGDTEGVRNWDQRAHLTAKEINALPDPPQVEFMKAAGRGQLELAVDFLLDPANLDDAHLRNPRVAHDAGVIVDKANRSSSGRITLPVEKDSAYGNLAPCTPENMVVFELDPQQMAGYQEMVYGSGQSNDLDDVFRRSWSYLRQIGIESTGQRVERSAQARQNPDRGSDGRYIGGNVSGAAPPIKSTGGSPVSNPDPETMSQRDYEAWRRQAS